MKRVIIEIVADSNRDLIETLARLIIEANQSSIGSLESIHFSGVEVDEAGYCTLYVDELNEDEYEDALDTEEEEKEGWYV